MHEGRMVFSQLLDFFPRHEFDKCVRRFGGNRRVREFSCFDQYLAMWRERLEKRTHTLWGKTENRPANKGDCELRNFFRRLRKGK
jgi:hypothetical protein